MTQRFDIACPPQDAFDGFTNPERIVAWWRDPEIYTTKSWTTDLRKGGRWRAEFEAADGTCFGADGEYVSVERPDRLDWTWRADWEPDVKKTFHMSFEPSPTGTALVIETTGYPSSDAQAADEAAWVTIIAWFNRTLNESSDRQ